MRRMEPKEKKAFEPTGLVPRSIVRTFERFRQQLLPGSERAAIREYRISRYQVLVSARCLFALLTIPIATNWFVSSWLLSPIIEHYWNTQQNEIFLNSYQEERAFAELEFFSNKLFFESLLSNQNDDSKNPKRYRAEKPFNIEIAKRRSFPEENQRLLFLNIEELRRPFSRSLYTPFCRENYLVKAVGRDRMRPAQDACTSDVSLPPFAASFVCCDIRNANVTFAPEVHCKRQKEGANKIRQHSFYSLGTCIDRYKEGAVCKGGETSEKMLSSRINEMNTRACQGQTIDTNPFYSVQLFNSNSATPGIFTNCCLLSTPFPQLSWKSSDMANSNTSPGLTSLFVGLNSNTSVVCHASHRPSKLCTLKCILSAQKVYQDAQSSQRRLQYTCLTPEVYKAKVRRLPLATFTLCTFGAHTPTFFAPPVHREEVSAKRQSYMPVFDFALNSTYNACASVFAPSFQSSIGQHTSFAFGNLCTEGAQTFFFTPKVYKAQKVQVPLSVWSKIAAERSTVGSFPAFGLTLPPYFQLGWGKVTFSDSLLHDAPEVQRRWEYVHQRCIELRLPKANDVPLLCTPPMLSRCIVNDAEKIVHPDTPSGLIRCISRCKAWKAGEMQGKRPLVKIVNSDKLESLHLWCTNSKATTAGEQNAYNKPIEGTEEYVHQRCKEFASCTNRVNLIGNFSSQTGYRRQTPESEDLMRQLKLNTLVSNMQKVQILKSRQATLVDRQLHYSAPFSGKKSRDQFLDILNTNNTENSVKIKERIQEKIVELAVYYNEQTILSITNIAGDFISVLTLGFLFIWMKPEISILKSFLIEAIYSLSDTTKSFLLILLTDLLVGFHSPRGWETALELLLKHFGLPENQDFVFLFVATFPVLLDTVFKYWIFRHLNKISPSTVATYHSMIE